MAAALAGNAAQRHAALSALGAMALGDPWGCDGESGGGRGGEYGELTMEDDHGLGLGDDHDDGLVLMEEEMEGAGMMNSAAAAAATAAAAEANVATAVNAKANARKHAAKAGSAG